jgi:hypothetical protein
MTKLMTNDAHLAQLIARTHDDLSSARRYCADVK